MPAQRRPTAASERSPLPNAIIVGEQAMSLPTEGEEMQRNPDVDAWFAERDHPLEEALREVREIILAADDRVSESIKWKTPTFSFEGNIVSFNPAKNFVSLLFHRGAEIPGDHPALEGDGRLARTMRFADAADVRARRGDLEAAVRSWCEWKSGG